MSNSDTPAVLLLIRANCDPSGSHTDQSRHKHPLQVAIYNGLLDIVKILYIASEANGANLEWLTLYLQDANLIEKSRRDEMVSMAIDWIHHQLQIKQTLNLQQLCRKVSRWHIGSKHFLKKVETLPLPQALKKFLCLNELICK